MMVVRKVLLVLLWGVAFVSFGANVYLQFYYKDYAPRAPQLDHIYPLNFHGTVVYLTQNENSRLNYLLLIAVASFVGAVTVNGLYAALGSRFQRKEKKEHSGNRDE